MTRFTKTVSLKLSSYSLYVSVTNDNDYNTASMIIEYQHLIGRWEHIDLLLYKRLLPVSHSDNNSLYSATKSSACEEGKGYDVL